MLFLGGKGATGEVQTTIALLRTGDKDAGRGGGAVRRLLAAAARVHARHRLQPAADRLQDGGAEALLHRALLLRPLAGHVQQLRQPHHLRISQRLVQGTSASYIPAGRNVRILAKLQSDNKNSSGDEIANVNFYAVRPEATRIR